MFIEMNTLVPKHKNQQQNIQHNDPILVIYFEVLAKLRVEIVLVLGTLTREEARSKEPEDLQIPSSSLADCCVFCHQYLIPTQKSTIEKQRIS